MSYKILNYVFLRFPNRLFCDWYLGLQDLDLWCFVCPNLIMNTKRRYRVVIQGIKFGKTKVLPLIHLLQNPTSSVKCCYHWNKTKTISQINKYQRYLEPHICFANFFSREIEIAGKPSDFLLLGVTQNILLRFKKSSKFYCVQTAKILKVKDISWQSIKFRPRWPVFAHFLNSNFLVIIPKKEN